MHRGLILLAVIAPAAISLHASDPGARPEIVGRLQQAVARTNIFELPSFVMKAKVHIENQGKSIDGTYQLLWNGPDQWREEISVPGYQEVKIAGKGSIWSQRSADHMPLRIYNLHQALGFGSEVASQSSSLVQLDLRDSDTIKKGGGTKLHGHRVACWKIEDTLKDPTEVCIDDSSGTLVRSGFVDGDFQPVGSKIFPRSLTGQVAVSITELKSPAEFRAEVFQLPPGASPHPGCMNPTPFRLIKRAFPNYPETARRQQAQGTVSVDVAIGIDGVPHVGAVVESPNANLSDATISAIKQWRYSPALCAGQPVEVDTVLQDFYELQTY